MQQATPDPALIGAFHLAQAYLGQYTGRTREAYDTDIRQWMCWLMAQGIPLLAAERMHIQAWDAHLRDQLGRSKATRSRKLTAVAGLYAYAEAEDKIPRSPARSVRRPRVSQDSSRAGFERDEVLTLLATAERHSTQAHALVCLLALHGLRVSEACGARAEDIQTVHGAGQDHRVLTVTGKGDKVRPVPLTDRTLAAIDAHLQGRPEGPIVGLNRNQAWRLVKQLLALAGLPAEGRACHSLRHAFATMALEVAPLHVVQDAMGHSSPTTTQRYNRQRHKLDGHAGYAVAGLLDAG